MTFLIYFLTLIASESFSFFKQVRDFSKNQKNLNTSNNLQFSKEKILFRIHFFGQKTNFFEEKLVSTKMSSFGFLDIGNIIKKSKKDNYENNMITPPTYTNKSLTNFFIKNEVKKKLNQFLEEKEELNKNLIKFTNNYNYKISTLTVKNEYFDSLKNKLSLPRIIIENNKDILINKDCSRISYSSQTHYPDEFIINIGDENDFYTFVFKKN